MRENCCERIVSKLQAATQARDTGLSCPKALLAAYEQELGDKFQATAELAKQMPMILAEPLCDVFAVTFAIIVQLTGIEDSYAETIARLRKEYGSNSCGSEGVETPLCTLRMKDCILMIQWALANHARIEYDREEMKKLA